jgi:hypothetical protein
MGLDRPIHIALVHYVKDDPDKFAADVALTVSGGGNIIRGGRMTYAGIRAIQRTQTMKRGVAKSYAAYKGAKQIVKGSKISRRGKVMASVGSVELLFDPDIPFVPYF